MGVLFPLLCWNSLEAQHILFWNVRVGGVLEFIQLLDVTYEEAKTHIGN